MQELGASVLGAYPALGIARIHLPTGSAAVVRRDSFVDFVAAEPTPDRTRLLAAPPANTFSNLLRGGSGPQRSGGTQVTPWNVQLINAPAAWPYWTGSGSKIMIISDGKGYDPDFPFIPASQCGGYFNACSPLYAVGTIMFSALTARDNQQGIVGVAPAIADTNLYIWNAYVQSATQYLFDWNSYYSALNAAGLMYRPIVVSDWAHTGIVSSEATAIATLWSQGTIFVSAAGDHQFTVPVYPGGYQNVVAVSGVRADSTLPPFVEAACPNYAPNTASWVTVVAPWAAFASRGSGDYIDTRSIGFCSTVISAAHVAGVIALIRQRFPQAAPWEVVQQLKRSSSNGNNPSATTGYGIVNALRAVQSSAFPPMSLQIGGPSSVKPSRECTWSVAVSGGTGTNTFVWSINGVATSQDPLFVYTSGSSSFLITVTVTDSFGSVKSANKSVTVSNSAPNCVS